MNSLIDEDNYSYYNNTFHLFTSDDESEVETEGEAVRAAPRRRPPPRKRSPTPRRRSPTPEREPPAAYPVEITTMTDSELEQSISTDDDREIHC